MAAPFSPDGYGQDELKEETIEDLEENMVIADMGDLAPQRPLLFPRFDGSSKPSEVPENSQPIDIDREGRMAAVKGALSAVLLIWLLYAVVFGLFILFMVKFVFK
jgi:hypothetical protein